MKSSQLVLWSVLAVPAAVTLARYGSGAIGYGEAIHESGEWAVRLLIVALAVTPLRSIFPRTNWARWLVRRRRDLGVAAFGYSLLHLAVYLWRKAEMPSLIVSEATDLGMASGWVAFIAFALLAVTSNDASVERLGPRWKALHRWVYPAAALAVAHWILTAFDPLLGWIHAAVLAVLIGARPVLRRLRPRPRAR